MIKNRMARVTTMVALATMAFFLFGFVTMSLWNWLMPALFGLRVITFWQAIGLMILGKLLVGGFHSHGGRRGHWRSRMRERWEGMTPEEREKFRSGIRGRCGFGEPPEAKPIA